MTALRLLISFAYAEAIDLPRVLEAAAGLDVELFADSGAYTVANGGGRIRLADYAAWLRDLGPLVRTAANLDVIGDADASARNRDRLAAAGLDVLPVFHLGSPWPLLEKMCADHPYLALGNMPTASRDLPLAMRNLVRCFRIAAEHGTVFHGFGMTHGQVLAGLPFYSADSSTWCAGVRFSVLRMWDDRRARFMPVRFGGPRRPTDWRPYRALIAAHGGDYATLSRPGCASRAERGAAEHIREREMVYRVNIMGMRRFEAWLRRRHGVAAPPGHIDEGTCLYLAGTTTREVMFLVKAVRHTLDNGTK